MNEKLQYAEMLEIPVSTCNVTYKPAKKKVKPFQKRTNVDVKQELIDKVNENTEEGAKPILVNPFEEETEFAKKQSSFSIKKAEKKKFPQIKLNVIGVQLIIIGVLVATIFLTSALVPNSGINVFMRNVFGSSATEEVVEDLRGYEEFNAVLPVNATNGVELDKGVATFSSAGSLYSPCDGKIKAITLDEETNKYTIEIMHSENFITVFSGVDYAYSAVGESVFSNIPVGYISENATMCFLNGEGDMITDYSLEGNSIVWAV